MHSLARDWPVYVMLGALILFVTYVAMESRRSEKKKDEKGKL